MAGECPATIWEIANEYVRWAGNKSQPGMPWLTTCRMYGGVSCCLNSLTSLAICTRISMLVTFSPKNQTLPLLYVWTCWFLHEESWFISLLPPPPQSLVSWNYMYACFPRSILRLWFSQMDLGLKLQQCIITPRVPSPRRSKEPGAFSTEVYTSNGIYVLLKRSSPF